MMGMHESLRGGVRHLVKGASPEIREILMACAAQGFTVKQTSHHHFLVLTPPEVRPKRHAFTPGTPSDIRSLHRVRAKLRAIGVEFRR